MKKGKLIIFEGVSGTGKETQARLLAGYLRKQGIKANIVYHPSPELKEILSLWRKNRQIDHVSEAYFLLADRYDRVRQVIKPAILRGEWVIGLRSYVSALVYQAETTSDRQYLEKEFLWFEPRPDLLVFFDLAPQQALARIERRHRETGEAFGKFETLKLLGEKRRRYQKVLQKIPHVAIDVGESVGDVHQQIRTYITPLLSL